MNVLVFRNVFLADSFRLCEVDAIVPAFSVVVGANSSVVQTLRSFLGHLDALTLVSESLLVRVGSLVLVLRPYRVVGLAFLTCLFITAL